MPGSSNKQIAARFFWMMGGLACFCAGSLLIGLSDWTTGFGDSSYIGWYGTILIVLLGLALTACGGVWTFVAAIRFIAALCRRRRPVALD